MASKKDNIKAIVAKEVASKHGIKTNHLYKVIRGDRDNDEVLADVFDLKQAIEDTIEAYQNNKLFQAVTELVPF